MEQISSQKVFEELLQNKSSFFLFKHSLTCPISAKALSHFESYDKLSHLPNYLIRIQENRELSNAISEQTGVKHESPQVILIQNGEVVWNASHSSITNNTLRDAEQKIM
ncbi:bacillithiol system redox-active protein YtxJ [Bacillaceae bacterium SIJ1]|uniref:bacillithiol system redox-active protein YtxJ n=1 Tax=Litoribacterium kuwaitense TaxID=1398745 RepID=UPI0013EC81D0|nr:bacillithiol system redox-active protein YtxJ [Litoribacterium kuwaitense]NGP44201.1 bacillithiol system redox-active protein YtxJ [Litoribacterium kuwaitense]